MKLEISTGWKVLLYVFAVILLIQGLDLSYYLMNQKDSYLANLGLITVAVTVITIGYCFTQACINGIQFIKEQIKKEKGK